MVTTVTNNSVQQINASLFSVDKQIEMLVLNIKKLEKDLADYKERVKKLEENTNTV